MTPAVNDGILEFAPPVALDAETFRRADEHRLMIADWILALPVADGVKLVMAQIWNFQRQHDGTGIYRMSHARLARELYRSSSNNAARLLAQAVEAGYVVCVGRDKKSQVGYYQIDVDFCLAVAEGRGWPDRYRPASYDGQGGVRQACVVDEAGNETATVKPRRKSARKDPVKEAAKEFVRSTCPHAAAERKGRVAEAFEATARRLVPTHPRTIIAARKTYEWATDAQYVKGPESWLDSTRDVITALHAVVDGQGLQMGAEKKEAAKRYPSRANRATRIEWATRHQRRRGVAQALADYRSAVQRYDEVWARAAEGENFAGDAEAMHQHERKFVYDVLHGASQNYAHVHQEDVSAVATAVATGVALRALIDPLIAEDKLCELPEREVMPQWLRHWAVNHKVMPIEVDDFASASAELAASEARVREAALNQKLSGDAGIR